MEMKVVYRLEDLPLGFPRPVATIGNFDGVHLGHEQLIRDLVRRADLIQGTPTVVTFHPHPLQVLAPDNAPRQIQTLDQKLAILKKLGVMFVAVIPFTREFALTSARDFADKIICEKLGIKEIYVGPNFAFGHRREGSFNLLKEIGARKGFVVGRIHQVQFRGNRVSSTAVRQALCAGQVALARRLLGRPFSLEGEIIHGAAIGKGMHVPTANLRTLNELVPRYGVYASRLTVGDCCYQGVTNIGIRPTVTAEGQATTVSIETHLLDFQGDIYGRKAKLELLLYLREERRFENMKALAGQILKDITRARRYFRWFERAAPSDRAEKSEPSTGTAGS
jgi:riboflavin kinase / FMN adenylyltransferase